MTRIHWGSKEEFEKYLDEWKKSVATGEDLAYINSLWNNAKVTEDDRGVYTYHWYGPKLD